MGRQAKKPIDIFEDADPLQSAQQFEIQQFFEEISASVAYMHFHRMFPDGRRPQIGKASLDVVREDPWQYIRDTYVPKYGGGKYLMIARADGSKFLGSRMIEVEGDMAPPASANGHATIAGMPDNLPFHDKLLLYSMFKPQQQQFDIGAMLAGVAAMMTAIRPAESAKPPDPIQMFQTIMQMYQGMKDKNEKSPLEQLRDVAGVIKEFSSDSKGIDSPWEMVASVGKDVVDKLAPVLTGMAGARVPAAVGTVRPAAAAVGAPGNVSLPATTGEQPPTTNPQDNLRNWLQTQISFLKQKAIAGKDPGFWIDYIFENAEEPGCQALMYALRQGATFEHLLAFDPEIGQNPQLTFWFREVYDGVKSGLQGDVDSGGESGNASNPSPNGGAGTSGQPTAGNSNARPPAS